MASMSVIEAASILMDLSTFKCNQEIHLKDSTRTRKNGVTGIETQCETECVVNPKPPRSSKAKKMKSITAADVPLFRDSVIIPRRPRSRRVAIITPTEAVAPPMSDMIGIPMRPRSPRVEMMKSTEAVAPPMSDMIGIPMRPRSPRVEMMKSTEAAAPPMSDMVGIPIRPRSPSVEMMKSTEAVAPPVIDTIGNPKRPRAKKMKSTVAPVERDMELVNLEDGQPSKARSRVKKMKSTVTPSERGMELVNLEDGQSSKAIPKVKKMKRKSKVKEIDLTATPEMPTTMRERILEMGGYDLQLVIQKQLHDTDLNKNQGRLSVPIMKLRFDFATKEEVEVLDRHDDKKGKIGIDVMIIDPSLRETVICLKKWKIGNNDVYCLMTHWNSFAKRNSLITGDVVQLWSFRKDGVDVANKTDSPHHICFAITKPHISEFN